MNDFEAVFSKIGFMQGRLSPIVDGKIQSFPKTNWRSEFEQARELNLKNMEWTLDQEDLYENPVMTINGREEILKLKEENNLNIPSLTGDCFMQSPFWKADNDERKKLENDFRSIIESCGILGIRIVVIPLVDNGSLENSNQFDILSSFLKENLGLLKSNKVIITFESDYSPKKLGKFIEKFDPELFGINYDIGNSAALGFNPIEEFNSYGSRVLNVHIKDRPFGGTTVPLGEGDADFSTVFKMLRDSRYSGNYILQTARSYDEKHSTVLKIYKEFTEDLLLNHL